ncbi:hypothetical protein [Variovorax sp. HJSM1_2]|uniref:hypothetical protein n=1 Tax=Variovorax sp. HJSM1_2 TaxID=3366263 RepID=UPI003BC87CA3
MSHSCAATDCQHQVPQRLLMCVDHWRMVPAPLRLEVFATLGKWKRVQRNPELALPAVKAYREAVAAAVAAVAAKQINKRAARAASSGDLFDQSPLAGPAQHPKEEHGNTTKQPQLRR